MPVQDTVRRSVEELDVIADVIEDIAEGMKRITSGKLNERAVILLIADASGVGKTDVQKVLEGMEGLRRRFRRRNAKGEYV